MLTICYTTCGLRHLDIDECHAQEKACGPGAVCRNLPGSYECVCPHGASGDPYAGCLYKASTQHSLCIQHLWISHRLCTLCTKLRCVIPCCDLAEFGKYFPIHHMQVITWVFFSHCPMCRYYLPLLGEPSRSRVFTLKAPIVQFKRGMCCHRWSKRLRLPKGIHVRRATRTLQRYE